MAESRLHLLILEAGLEDDIPLPEIARTVSVAGLIPPDKDLISVLSAALVALLRTGSIRVLVGHWSSPEPRYAATDEAERLVTDRRRYSFEEEAAHALERVYFVNVDNIAGVDDS